MQPAGAGRASESETKGILEVGTGRRNDLWHEPVSSRPVRICLHATIQPYCVFVFFGRWHFNHGAGGAGFTFGAIDLPKALAVLKEIGDYIREA